MAKKVTRKKAAAKQPTAKRKAAKKKVAARKKATKVETFPATIGRQDEDDSSVAGTDAVRIQVPQERRQGAYSNFIGVAHTDYEFMMDFVFTRVGEEPLMLSRIIMSPTMAKRVLGVLETNLKKYEDKHGQIED